MSSKLMIAVAFVIGGGIACNTADAQFAGHIHIVPPFANGLSYVDANGRVTPVGGAQMPAPAPPNTAVVAGQSGLAYVNIFGDVVYRPPRPTHLAIPQVITRPIAPGAGISYVIYTETQVPIGRPFPPTLPITPTAPYPRAGGCSGTNYGH